MGGSRCSVSSVSPFMKLPNFRVVLGSPNLPLESAVRVVTCGWPLCLNSGLNPTSPYHNGVSLTISYREPPLSTIPEAQGTYYNASGSVHCGAYICGANIKRCQAFC